MSAGIPAPRHGPKEASRTRDAQLESRRRAVADAFDGEGPLARAVAGFAHRDAQQELALAVFDAIAERGTLAAEAGTGTGKTLAYLVPAILAGGKILISAATRTLQEQIYAKDLPAVCRALDARIDAAMLKGRQNYICRLRLERTASAGTFESLEDVGALQRIVRFARETETGDRAELASVPESAGVWPAVVSTRDTCLGSECAHFEDCFVVKARRRALAADVVVVNHHLLLADMALREDAVSELLPNADVLIVDEAHHLGQIAADFFGDLWSIQQVLELCADVQRIGLQVAPDGAPWRELARALEFAARAVRTRLQEGGVAAGARIEISGMREIAPLREALAALEAARGALRAAVDGNLGRDRELDALQSRVERLGHSLAPWLEPAGAAQDDASVAHDASVVRWIAMGAHGAQFRETPLRCAEYIARARDQRIQAWILTSATLTAARRFEPFLDEVGLPGARVAQWDSPFDFARQALLYLPEHMPNAQSVQFPEDVADAAWPVVCASRGRAFILCSTLRAVSRVARRLREHIEREGQALSVLEQGASSRAAMLAEFRGAANAILVGSVSFWEGVDVRGPALSVVVIDKLPFAPPDDPLVAARIRLMRSQGRNPFRDYQLPQAIRLLRQGAGRLIRGDSDRGVLMILDGRILGRSYGSAILASLPPFSRTRSEREACDFLKADD